MEYERLSHTRRQMLFGMAGAALAYSQPRNRIYSPQLAAHTSIWQNEAERRNCRLADLVDEAFASTERAGYRRIELVSEFLSPELQQRTLAALRKNHLQPAIVFASGSLLDRETAEGTRERVLQLARLMSGFDTRFFNFSPAAAPGGRQKTAEELETQSYQLNRMGQDLTQNGMALMVHHELPEMRDDAREWKYTVAHTETGLVSFCLDVDWIVRAGLRPLPLMDTANARLRNLHLRNPRLGVNQESLREGDINMFEIARFLRQMSYDGFLTVELQHDRDTVRQHSLTENLSLSRWYMQQIFGSRPGNPPVDMGPHVRDRRS
jgi:sugar phosphate isomerase/epimerase